MRPLSPMNEPELAGELMSWWTGESETIVCQQWQLQVGRRRSLRNTRQTNNCLRVLYDRLKTRFSFIRFLYCDSPTQRRDTPPTPPPAPSRGLYPTQQISIVFHCFLFLVDTLYLTNWIKWELCNYAIELNRLAHSGTKYCRSESWNLFKWYFY